MTEYFLAGHYETLELHHVRMGFSDDIQQVGQAGLGKVFHLVGLVFRTLRARFRTGAKVLYYPPSGPNIVPFLRDCAFLILVRPFFSRTVFHFHAAGLSGFYDRLPAPLKLLFHLAYNRPDSAITISQDGIRDAEVLKARRIAFVPNGIPDVWPDRRPRSESPKPTILFLAMVCEEKGVGVLIEACLLLKSAGLEFSCKIAGRASSDDELAALQKMAAPLGDCVEFTGPVIGQAKWDLFAESDVFCFPTFYPPESFGLVVVEAMMAGLPVVASDWRALPEIVVEGETGFLVPVRDASATAKSLAALLSDPALRKRMGAAGRRRYEDHYRVEVFQRGMEDALISVGGTAAKAY